jgi:hypothetical protein
MQKIVTKLPTPTPSPRSPRIPIGEEPIKSEKEPIKLFKEEPSISVVEEPIKGEAQGEEPIELTLEEGQMVPTVSTVGEQQEGETDLGIPVGGGTRRRRRERLRKRGAKSVSRSSRLVGRTIGRKPKRKRKFGRRGKIKTRRRRTIRRQTIRRRTTRRRTRK